MKLKKTHDTPQMTSDLVMSHDGFIWKALSAEDARSLMVLGVLELYELDDTDTDHLLENLEALNEAIGNGSLIVIEVGSLPDSMATEVIGVLNRRIKELKAKEVPNVALINPANSPLSELISAKEEVLSLFNAANKDHSNGYIFDSFSAASKFHRDNKVFIEKRENEVRNLPGVDSVSTILTQNSLSVVIGKNDKSEIIVVKPLLPYSS